MKPVNIKKHTILAILISLIFSLVIEVIIFNKDALLSINSREEIELEYTLSNGVKNGEWCNLAANEVVSINIDEIDTKFDYLMVDIECIDEGKYYSGKSIPLNVYISISDEGNSIMYKLPREIVYSDIESTKYINMHSYGDIKSMRIDFYRDDYDSMHNFGVNTSVCVNKIVGNTKVPFFFNYSRIILYWGILLILWYIRPNSRLYNTKFTYKQKKIAVMITLIINIGLWYSFTFYGNAFKIFNEQAQNYMQYHKLAVALANGKVDIDLGIDGLVDSLKNLANPYDTYLREQELGSVDFWNCWDIAYYNGKLYSYFGIVPVLIFYLPFYLLTGYAFPTWFGVFNMGIVVITGIFYLLHQIIKKFFPETHFILYLTLSVLFANSIGTVPFMMKPDIYVLPIISAIGFSMWGLGLWLSASDIWCNEKNYKKSHLRARIFAGSLCMALVAGCRPQFLLGSFIVFFIFRDCFKNEISRDRKKLIINIVIGLIPYVIIACGLMYYNYIRFDSPFDFGANYNITTNDMTHRGFNLGRIPDGIFMYIFQLPKLNIKYPYVFEADFISSYIGKTIREKMFGGILFINPLILLGIIGLKSSKKQLKEKKLYKLIILLILFAVVIVIADTQMAGILGRYYGDFAWLANLATVFIVLQLYENTEQHNKRSIIQAINILGVYSIIVWFFIGMHISFCIEYDVVKYYSIRNYFIN